jgi:hypothetical protein
MDFAISNPIVVTCFILALVPTQSQIILRDGGKCSRRITSSKFEATLRAAPTWSLRRPPGKPQIRERSFFIGSGEPAVSDDVGHKDRCKLPGLGHCVPPAADNITHLPARKRSTRETGTWLYGWKNGGVGSGKHVRPINERPSFFPCWARAEQLGQLAYAGIGVFPHRGDQAIIGDVAPDDD